MVLPAWKTRQLQAADVARNSTAMVVMDAAALQREREQAHQQAEVASDAKRRCDHECELAMAAVSACHAEWLAETRRVDEAQKWCPRCGQEVRHVSCTCECSWTQAQDVRGLWVGDCYTFSVLWNLRSTGDKQSISNEAKQIRHAHYDYLGEHLLGPLQQQLIAVVVGVRVLVLYQDATRHTLTPDLYRPPRVVRRSWADHVPRYRIWC